MWVRSAAIRPVPPYAVIPAEAFDEFEEWLTDFDERVAEQRLNEVFDRLERAQPALARRVGDRLGRVRDEVALALGYYLCLTIWRVFDGRFGDQLDNISDTALDSVDEALRLDEQLRGADPAEAVDSDDVVAMEQPHILAFVSQHIDAALDVHAVSTDVDAVHAVYRLVLVQVLALSYAVAAPEAGLTTTSEMYA
jgi:hypothetical protein